MKVLTEEQTAAVKLMLEKAVELDKERGRDPDHWFSQDIKDFVKPFLKKYKKAKTISLDQDTLDEIACITQDIVSFRAGPQNEMEEHFFDALGCEDDED